MEREKERCERQPLEEEKGNVGKNMKDKEKGKDKEKIMANLNLLTNLLIQGGEKERLEMKHWAQGVFSQEKSEEVVSSTSAHNTGTRLPNPPHSRKHNMEERRVDLLCTRGLYKTSLLWHLLSNLWEASSVS